MCGFAGYIGLKKTKPSAHQLDKSLKILFRRGPDSKGKKLHTLNNKIIHLIHTRLSIIDLQEKSNQPLEDEHGTIIFNGMIYNYLELKDLLKKKGVKFNTNSDTEVLLKMLNVFGTNSLNMLDGMWSFAYFNKKNNYLILCRDRFGEKPLYFSKSKKNIYFSNSIKALSALYPKKISLNKNKIEEYLRYPDKSSGLNNSTFFNQIESLEPGYFLKVNFKNLTWSRKKYWNLKVKNTNVNYNDAIKKIKNLTAEAIKTRTRSDVKSCLLLSGGLDSNTIAAKIKDNSFAAYSLISSNKNYNESKLIKMSAISNNLKLNLIPSENSKSLSILKELIRNSYNLIPATTALGFAILCKKIKKDKNKVILTGAGGDELFAGYYVNFLAQILSFKGNKQREKRFFWENNIKKFIRNPLLKNFQDKKLKKNLHRLNFFIEEDGLLNKYFLRQKKYKIKKYFKDPFYNNMFQNLFCQSIPAQNIQYDLVSMNYSLESRAPFLSHKLAEYVYSLKKDFFMYKGRTKSLLRDSIKKIVHKSIISNYEKTGFYSPFMSFFKKKDQKNVINLIAGSKFIFKFISKKKLLNLLEKKSKNITHTESKLLFACLNVTILEQLIYKKSI